MSLDELARAASADLRRAVDRQVTPEQARERLGRRMVARRFEHGLAAVVVVLVAAVGFLAVRDLGNPGALPAGPTRLDPTAAPAADCLFTITCRTGSYRAALSVPLTFRTAGVVNVRSDSPGRLELTDQTGDFSLTVLSDPTPVGGTTPPRSRGARGLAEWLASRRDAIVSTPLASSLGGRPALVVDVHPKEGAEYAGRCPPADGCVVLFGTAGTDSTGPANLGVARYEVLRIYLLDIPDEGTVAVVLEDWSSSSGDAPAAAASLLRPVLDSLAFGSP